MNNRLYELVARLVAVDTVSHRTNLPAAELLADQLDACGFAVMVRGYTDPAGIAKANVVASIGPEVEGGILLSGHIDTVPWEQQPGWNSDPLRLVLSGDRYIGRGIADMKGFLAECAIAASSLEPDQFRRPLMFLFTADEEVGCLGAARIADELASLVGDHPLPKLAWIGEPTSFQIHHAHKSAVLFSVNVRGRGGHSGLPDRGVNAITIAARVVDAVAQLNEQLRGEHNEEFRELFSDSPFPTINVGTIQGGTAANVIADQCELRMLYRSMPGRDPLEIYEEVRRRLARLDATERPDAAHRATIEIGAPTVVPPMLTPRGTRLERALRELANVGEPTGSLLAADGCRLEPLGIATLICGPGEFDQAHQPNESIAARSLERGLELVRRVIHRLCVELD